MPKRSTYSAKVQLSQSASTAKPLDNRNQACPPQLASNNTERLKNQQPQKKPVVGSIVVASRPAQKIAMKKSTPQNSTPPKSVGQNAGSKKPPALNSTAQKTAASYNLAIKKPASQNLAAQKPASQNLAAQKTASHNLAAQKTASHNLAAQKPASYKSATQKPASQNLEIRKPYNLATKKPAAPHLVAQKPAVQKPAPSKPSAAAGTNASQMHKRSFLTDQEIQEMFSGVQTDKNNNLDASYNSLNLTGPAIVDIYKVYTAQQHAFDKLDGSRLVEDVLLRGKYWRDILSAAEAHNDQISVHGLNVVFYNPTSLDMSKKRFFSCIHLHNALRNYGVRSALAVHIDISRIRHRKVAEMSKRMFQLVGDGYNLLALQFKNNQTNEKMRKLFLEPGAYGIYIGFAFILDYLTYRNTYKKSKASQHMYDLKKYVEHLGDEGYVIRAIDKSAGQAPFEFEVSQSLEDLNLEYVEHLFNGVRFTQ